MFFITAPGILVHIFKQEGAHDVGGFLHFLAHGDVRPVRAVSDDVHDHGVDALTMGLSQHFDGVFGQLLLMQNARADGVIDVMVNVGNPVRLGHHHAFQAGGLEGAGVVDDAIAHFPGQVEAIASLQLVHHAQALHVVLEAARGQLVQCALPDVAKGCVAKVMRQGDGFGQVFVQKQAPGDGARHLGHFQGVRQPGAVMVSLRRQKNLCLELQATKPLGMDDTVPVTLKLCSAVVFADGARAAF